MVRGNELRRRQRHAFAASNALLSSALDLGRVMAPGCSLHSPQDAARRRARAAAGDLHGCAAMMARSARASPTLDHPPIDVLAPNATPSSSTDRAMLRVRAAARLSLSRMLVRKEEL